MILLTPEQTTSLKNWFLPEIPGPLMIGLHVIQTGNGACLADRWPDPRALLVETAGNYTLLGEGQALSPEDLRPHIAGFVDTSEDFVPLLKAAFPKGKKWSRVIFEQQAPPNPTSSRDYLLRRLGSSDTYHLWGLSPKSNWVSKTWGGPAALAASGLAWGAFVADQLASVSCTFFVGEKYEDIGVVTEPQFQGLGLSTACAGALCADIHTRGRQPSWTTSPDNIASIRVAEKLGFVLQRHDHLYVAGISIPESVDPPSNS